MDHYRGVQPDPRARRGVAEFPKQIREAGPWLAELAPRVPGALSSKPVLLIWGRRDRAFGPKAVTNRWTADFPDATLIDLPDANHFIQEDAPAEIAEAVRGRFS
jgi:haloalkane dehalogenase